MRGGGLGNVSSTGCYVDLMDNQLGDEFTVMVCGYKDGRWYSRSFAIALQKKD